MSDFHSSSPLVLTTCVIGGAGFIGRAVVDELLTQGRRVLVVGRGTDPATLPAGVDYLENPPNDGGAALQAALTRVDEVVDLAYATVPQTSYQDPVNDILVNLPEAVRLFEMASALPIRKFVWVSSGGTVYGRTTAASIDESHPTQPLSPYGITKLAIEKYAHMYFESRGLPIVCVRPSNAFGESQRPYIGQGFIATAIASVLDERELTLFGAQGTVRDYLHVRDVASGIVAALVHGRPGEIYNIGSGQGLSNRQVLDALAPLATAAGHEVRVVVQPSRPFDVPRNVLDYTKLHNDTGWYPSMSFPEALQRTWAWYLSKHQHSAFSAQAKS
ncbi:NAD-dependent epimerase/dehydratase family protein [Hymenobacter weizhouensis]|uniref:NAD-dependent epimerase/dehydratase family protein n=1 Tax=Hymenobacter sp. YIM 151500-1 TaxID=2987689 RepID=UPI00222696B8|nr:NAD-dependent epimerase/dehydratase family protein [Hymenobacter sp. YIM 151500-1]UYZ61362.1 NAD-dependent epimerase/dehydratase family protein [Hymenobacter sp. YIM 151500-1]